MTGGAHNIGEAYARGLAAAGALVAVADIDGEGVEQVVKEINAAGGRAIAVVADVTNDEEVQAMVAATVADFGGLDAIVNNAAIYAGLKILPMEETDLDEWDRVMNVNVKGTFLCSRAAAAVMGQGGSIVNISSTSALAGVQFMPHYVASKGAVIALTRSLARAYGFKGIRANTVAPGIIFDQATIDMLPDPSMGDLLLTQQILCQRQEPNDLVGTVMFLVSDDSRFITGQTLVVDGGMILH